MAAFRGFGPQALPFFTALKFHQSRDWFEANRALYESDVLLPMTALLDDLTTTFRAARIPLMADGRRSIFRIHRDVRFARDKSPYKTHAGAVMTRTGDKKDDGLLYIHIDPEGCFVAAGFYMPEPATLLKLRQVVRDRPRSAATLLNTIEANRLELGTFDQLSRLPRGFEDLKDGPFDGIVRMKSLIVEEKVPDSLIVSPKLANAVLDFAKRSLPLLEFGWKAV